MVTTSGTACPLLRYSVLGPVPLSETHQDVVGPWVSPQGFLRLASVNCAQPGTSETRLVSR